MTVAALRCPVNPSRQFARVLDPRPSESTIEVACSDCRRVERRRRPDVVRVLHRYATDGDYESTEVVYLEVE